MKYLWLLAIFYVAPLFAYVGSVNIQWTGTIVLSNCDVEINSQNQSIHIGDFDKSTFTQVGDVTSFKAFNINLKNCTTGIEGARVMFTGQPDNNNPYLLSLSDTSGAGNLATGVGIEILDNSLNPLPINNTSSNLFPLSVGDNTLSFLLRYKATKIPVTAGNASSVMYFDISYE